MHRRTLRRRHPSSQIRHGHPSAAGPGSGHTSTAAALNDAGFDCSGAEPIARTDRNHSSRKPCCDLARRIARDVFPELASDGDPATPAPASASDAEASSGGGSGGGGEVGGATRRRAASATAKDGDSGGGDEDPPPLLARMIRRGILDLLAEEKRRCSGGDGGGVTSSLLSAQAETTGAVGGGGKKKKRKKKKKKAPAAASDGPSLVLEDVVAKKAPPMSNLQALSEAAAALAASSDVAPEFSSVSAAAAARDQEDTLASLLEGPSIDRDGQRFAVPDGRSLSALLEHVASSSFNASISCKPSFVGITRRRKKPHAGKFTSASAASAKNVPSSSHPFPAVSIASLRWQCDLIACQGCRNSSFGYLTELSRRHSGAALGHGGMGVSWGCGDGDSIGANYPSPYPSSAPTGTPSSSDGEGEGGSRRERRVYLRVDGDSVKRPEAGAGAVGAGAPSRAVPKTTASGWTEPPDLLNCDCDDVEGAFGYRALEEGTFTSSESGSRPGCGTQEATSEKRHPGVRLLLDLASDKVSSSSDALAGSNAADECEYLRPRHPLSASDLLSLFRHVLLPCGVPSPATAMEEEHDRPDLLTYHPDEFASCRRRWAGRRRVSALVVGLLYEWLDERCREWHSELCRGELLEGFLLEEGADEGGGAAAPEGAKNGATSSSGVGAAGSGGKKVKKRKKKKGKKTQVSAATTPTSSLIPAEEEEPKPEFASAKAKDIELPTTTRKDEALGELNGETKGGEKKPLADDVAAVSTDRFTSSTCSGVAITSLDNIVGACQRAAEKEGEDGQHEASHHNRTTVGAQDDALTIIETDRIVERTDAGKMALVGEALPKGVDDRFAAGSTTKAKQKSDADNAGGEARAETCAHITKVGEREQMASLYPSKTEQIVKESICAVPSSPPALGKCVGMARVDVEAEKEEQMPPDRSEGREVDVGARAAIAELLAAVDARVGVIDYRSSSLSVGGGGGAGKFISAEEYLVRRLKRTILAMSRESMSSSSSTSQ